MKIAIILTAAAFLAGSHAAVAQTYSNPRPAKAAHGDNARTHGATAASQSVSDNDRAIDAELKRIDRMMTICTGC